MNVTIDQTYTTQHDLKANILKETESGKILPATTFGCCPFGFFRTMWSRPSPIHMSFFDYYA